MTVFTKKNKLTKIEKSIEYNASITRSLYENFLKNVAIQKRVWHYKVNSIAKIAYLYLN